MSVTGLGHDDPSDAWLFDQSDLRLIRGRVRLRARLVGLSADRAEDLVLAVHEIAAAAFAVDDRPTLLLVTETAGALVCEVTDFDSPVDPAGPGAGRRLTDPAMTRGRGWRIAAALCDRVACSADGTAVRITVLVPETSSRAGALSEHRERGD